MKLSEVKYMQYKHHTLYMYYSLYDPKVNLTDIQKKEPENLISLLKFHYFIAILFSHFFTFYELTSNLFFGN